MKNNILPFVKSLYSILNNSSLSTILHWCQEGCSFTIINIPDFESIILSNFFPDMTLNQFISQLKSLSFNKNTSNSSLEFSHEHFSIQNPELLKKISSSKPKPSRSKNTTKAEILKKLTAIESKQLRIQEISQDLEHKIQSVIDLNKYMLENFSKPKFEIDFDYLYSLQEKSN